MESELRGMGRNVLSVQRDFLKYTEYKHVMFQTEPLFEDGYISRRSNDSLTRLLLEDAASGIKSVGFVAGVVLREKVHVLQRVIWRVCQGNVFFSHSNILDKIEDPDTGTEVFKSVFYAIYQGDNLEQKVMKVCEGFRANVYNCPTDVEGRTAVWMEISLALEDLDEIILEANAQRRHILEIAANNIIKWKMMIWKAKATFTVMNKFQPDKMHKVFIAECWVPNCKFKELNKVLLMNQSDIILRPVLVKIDTEEIPPTFHDLNKFTRVFQDLIDAYGSNTYQEHNPAPYYVVTFPFLFSIMFGDAGHGVIMTLAAVYLLMNEESFERKPPGGEIGRIFYAGRYIILLMGLFSIQSGLLYNDIFSRCTHFFDSSWHVDVKIHQLARLANQSFFFLDPETDWDGTPYPFGLDPVWQIAKNAIVFRNSLKMKMSIIFGVVQMLFGLVCGINNIVCISYRSSHFHSMTTHSMFVLASMLSIENLTIIMKHVCYISKFFKNFSDIGTVFIPQIIFLTFLFMYLSILIIIKWLIYGPHQPQYRSPGCAPSILNMFIGMILFTDTPTPDGCHKDMYAYQHQVQLVLLGCALVCVPWLFLVKPVLDIKRNKKLVPIRRQSNSIDRDSTGLDDIHHPHKFHHRDQTSIFRPSAANPASIRGISIVGGEPDEPYYDFCQRFGHNKVTEAEEKRKQSLAKYSFPDKKMEVIEKKRNSSVEKRATSLYSSMHQRQSACRESRLYSENPHSPWETRASIIAADHEESNFDIFIHQAIHSIEFLLGTVSNTASYLRLWALSLAHEQLSHVVWKQLFGIALTAENSSIQPILIVVIFLFWAVLSVAILVLMEGLSAFLHTLRLHWIEFQSKFYDGNGRNFQPFDFAEIIKTRQT